MRIERRTEPHSDHPHSDHHRNLHIHTDADHHPERPEKKKPVRVKRHNRSKKAKDFLFGGA